MSVRKLLMTGKHELPPPPPPGPLTGGTRSWTGVASSADGMKLAGCNYGDISIHQQIQELHG